MMAYNSLWKSKRVFLTASALALVLAAPSPVAAQSLMSMSSVMSAPAGPVISDIRIQGAQRLEESTILSSLKIAKGDQATPDNISESLKALFATGLFADIDMAVENDVLIITVVENPVVNSVKFDGLDTLTEEDITKEIHLRSRHVYTLPKVQQDVQRILDLYRRSGRFAATCDPHVKTLDQNRVDVTFEIVEGDHTGVRRIEFLGNKHFSDSDLRIQINTVETAWWRFFSTSDYYDPDRVTYDKELLRRFYLQQGYVDFHVVSSSAEMTPDKKDFFLTFSLDEGQRYKFGSVKIDSEVKGLDTAEFEPELLTKEGEWYDSTQVENTITKLTAMLGDKQYAFIDIRPDVDIQKEEGVVNLVYQIKPGKRIHIGRIDITGNTRTLDKVIRREIPLAEGDPYNNSKIKKAEQQIKDLGYFESVKVTPSPGVQPDRSDVKVEVKEKPTGEISLGAGFSTSDGALGNFSIRERNFLGKGQIARLGATVSGDTKQIDLGFTEPYFLDRDLSAGVDLFHTRTDYEQSASDDDDDEYSMVTTGFSFHMGYPLSTYLRQNISYTLRQEEAEDISSTASRFVQELEGKNAVSMVSQTLSYDRRDSKLTPEEGYLLKLQSDVAGLGGNRHFYRLVLSGQQYYKLMDGVVLSTLGEVGYIDGFGENIRTSDRFKLGGKRLRGFQYGLLGPSEAVSDFALGGQEMARTSVELSFPTFMPENLGFKGHAFVDAGVLSKIDETQASGEYLRDSGSVRASAGLGISWDSPFGPVRLDYALPFLKEDYDEEEHINFSFGTSF